MRENRILFVTTVAQTARAFLIPYATKLHGSGWKVDLAANGVDAPDIRGSFSDAFEMRWSRGPLPLYRTWDGLKDIYRLLSVGKYSIVHVHTPIASLLTRLALAFIDRSKRPHLIYTAHGFHFHRNGSFFRNFLFGFAERIFATWTSTLIVINEEDYRVARGLRLARDGSMFLVPGIGLDVSHYQSRIIDPGEISQFRERFAIPREAIIVSMVAEFNPGKNHLDAIRALELVREKRVHLVMAGDGPMILKCRKLAGQLNLESRCHFLGFVRDVPLLFACSSVSILPSEREGLPRAVMEAMACSVPVVGADSRGIRDLLSPGCGVLHRLGSPFELALGIDRILSSDGLRDVLVKNALLRVAGYDIGPIVDWHLVLYNRILTDCAIDDLSIHRLRSETSPTPVPETVVVVGGLASSLINFRGTLIRRLKSSGREVVCVAGDFDINVERQLMSWGVTFVCVSMSRTGVSPFEDYLYFRKLSQLVRNLSPRVVFAYTHKPVVYSAFCKRSSGAHSLKVFGLITGLGYAFGDVGIGGVRQRVVLYALRWLYRRSATWSDGYMFQNEDDRQVFLEQRILRPSIASTVVRGSGVDLDWYQFSRRSSDELVFLFVGRLLKDKGVREFIEAAGIVHRAFPAARFIVAGGHDLNPSSIPREVISAAVRDGHIEYVGPVLDVRPLLRDCLVFVLPSYREGTPRTVLEAMAVGRAVVTTDVPGCRDTVLGGFHQHGDGVSVGRNGMLVRARSASALASALEAFCVDPGLARRMGIFGFEIAREFYDVNKVNESMFRFMGINDYCGGRVGLKENRAAL